MMTAGICCNPERSCSVAGEGASAITVQLTGGSLSRIPAGKGTAAWHAGFVRDISQQ